jgi:hypothetical protein
LADIASTYKTSVLIMHIEIITIMQFKNIVSLAIKHY